MGLYVGMLMIFGGLYGFYNVATTIIFQFQAIKGYNMMDSSLAKSEIWGAFGVYSAVQVMAAFIGEHYLLGSIFYLLSSGIKEWCENHPSVCDDYSVLEHEG